MLGWSDERIKNLARLRLWARFILCNRRCLPPGDIKPTSFRTYSGMELDHLGYHFLAISRRLLLFTNHVFIFVGFYSKGRRLRRNVSGKLK